MKKRKGWRTLTIGDKKWIWKVGRGNVVIRDSEDKQHFVNFSTLTGIGDTERAAWKGYLHIKPSHVRNYIDVHLRKRSETKITIVKKLKDIFNKEIPAQYIGGTLTFSTDNNENIAFMNVGQGETEEEKCWIALNYIKYKNSDRAFYKEAIEIVSGKPEYRKFLTKALIASIMDYN